MSRVGETLATCRVGAPPSPLPHEDDRPSSPTSRRRQRAITSALLYERRRDPTRMKNTHESEPGKRCSNNSNKRVHGTFGIFIIHTYTIAHFDAGVPSTKHDDIFHPYVRLRFINCAPSTRHRTLVGARHPIECAVFNAALADRSQTGNVRRLVEGRGDDASWDSKGARLRAGKRFARNWFSGLKKNRPNNLTFLSPPPTAFLEIGIRTLSPRHASASRNEKKNH